MPKSAFTGGQKKIFREGMHTGRKSIQQAAELAKPGAYTSQYGKAVNVAREQMMPHNLEMRRQFMQEEAPQMMSQFTNSRSSSALNQALAAAMTNLNERMQSNVMDRASQIAQNEMAARQQQVQFNSNMGMNMLGQSPYLPSSGAPSATKQMIGHGLNIGAQAAGTYFGGPVGGAAAGQGMSMLTSKLTGGQQSPDFSQQFGGMDFFKKGYKPQAGA